MCEAGSLTRQGGSGEGEELKKGHLLPVIPELLLGDAGAMNVAPCTLLWKLDMESY